MLSESGRTEYECSSIVNSIIVKKLHICISCGIDYRYYSKWTPLNDKMRWKSHHTNEKGNFYIVYQITCALLSACLSIRHHSIGTKHILNTIEMLAILSKYTKRLADQHHQKKNSFRFFTGRLNNTITYTK